MRERHPARSAGADAQPARNLGERLARQVREGEPPAVAAMQLLMEAASADEACAALVIARRLQASHSGAAGPGSSLHRIAELIERDPSAWQTVHGLAGSIDHRPVANDPLAHWSSLFDELVRLSPEGSVALYSLGDAHLLAEATSEIVALLEGWGLLDPRSAVLDIGCGIGRLEAALAPRVASVTGVDISQAMLAEARRRSTGLTNVRLALASGGDLTGFADESVDLALLVDTLPYVMLSGATLAKRLCSEAARVLVPGGSLLILNATYGRDADADLASIAQLAEEAGLEFHRADWRPFRFWDAPAFQLKRAARSPA